MHVGFPAAEAPRIVKKRSGAPPEASGSTIFGQNRHFTRVLARSRLLTVSLPNAFFLSNFQKTLYFTSQNGPPRPISSYFTMNYGARKGQKMTAEVAKTLVKRQFCL